MSRGTPAVRSSTMKSYQLETEVRAETNSVVFGPVTGTFGPGTVTPASEQDELLLEHLVSIGMAAVVETESKPRRGGKQEA